MRCIVRVKVMQDHREEHAEKLAEQLREQEIQLASTETHVQSLKRDIAIHEADHHSMVEVETQLHASVAVSATIIIAWSSSGLHDYDSHTLSCWIHARRYKVSSSG